MDSQRTVDHLRDEANARKDTTLGNLLDTAAEELDDAEDAIERLQKERDDLSKRLERMHRPRCDGFCDDPEGPWPLLENPCQFCGARSESDACRDMADTADCDKIRQERDAALAKVERLKGEVEWREKRDEKQSDMIRTIDPLYR